MAKGKVESDVLKDCLGYLNLCGIYCWRNNTGAVRVGKRFVRFGKKGSSDILGIMPDGKFLAVECKRENGGILSDDQKEFLQSITDNGGIAIVVNSVESLKIKLELLE